MAYSEDEINENVEGGSDSSTLDAEAVQRRTELYERLNKMSKRDRQLLMKHVQFNTLMETLDAVKNMKKTKKETWQNIIKKLNALTGFNIGDGKMDFNEFLGVLIPLIGILAGTLLAIRESESAEIEASAPDSSINPLLGGDDGLGNSNCPALDNDNIFEDAKRKSIVLQYCDSKENGFEL